MLAQVEPNIFIEDVGTRCFFYLKGLIFTEDVVRFGGKLTERMMSNVFDLIVIDMSEADSSSLKFQRLVSVSSEIARGVESIELLIRLNENQGNFYCIDFVVPDNVKVEIVNDEVPETVNEKCPVSGLKNTVYFLAISFVLLVCVLVFLCVANDRGIIYWALSFSTTLMLYEVVVLWRVVSGKFMSIKGVVGRV